MDWLRKKFSLNTALFVAAVSLGVAAYWGVTRYVATSVERVRQAEAERFGLTPLVVAARDLPAGFLLDAGALAIRAMPRAFVSADAVAVDRAASLIGRALRQPVRAGELLVPALLAEASRPAFSEQIEPGRRAVTVPVDEVSAFDGLLSPGDHVDLLFSHQNLRSEGEAGPVVQVLLAKVPVLATGRATRRTLVQAADGTSQEVDSTFSTATLSVSPAEAQIITLAQRAGEIVATLRHPQDTTALDLPVLDTSALRNRATAPKLRRASAAGIVLISGGRGGPPSVEHLRAIASGN